MQNEKYTQKEGTDVQVYNPEMVLQTPEEQIAGTTSFEELYNIINTTGNFVTGVGILEPSVLINIINKVKNGKGELTAITRTAGLRDKVNELMEADKNNVVDIAQQPEIPYIQLEDSGNNQEVVALTRAELIAGVSSFKKLFEIISWSGDFNTSIGVQTPTEVIMIINSVLKGEGSIKAITSTDGLRDKVIELMNTEKNIIVEVVQENPNGQQENVENNQESVDFSRSEKIAGAINFEDLYNIIRSAPGNFYSTSGSQTAEEVIANIDFVRFKDYPASAITRAYGLREKVISLINKAKNIDKSNYGWVDKGSMAGSGAAEDLSKYNNVR